MERCLSVVSSKWKCARMGICSAGEGRIEADAYSLLPGDLRNTRACQAALEAACFDPACPTYVLAECVLVYMEPGDSAAVVRWLGHWLPTAAFVVYEQVSAQPRQARAWLDRAAHHECLLTFPAIPDEILPISGRILSVFVGNCPASSS